MGFRVQGLGLRVEGLGFRVEGLGHGGGLLVRALPGEHRFVRRRGARRLGGCSCVMPLSSELGTDEAVKA